jgi:hypothetical protein
VVYDRSVQECPCQAGLGDELHLGFDFHGGLLDELSVRRVRAERPLVLLGKHDHLTGRHVDGLSHGADPVLAPD